MLGSQVVEGAGIFGKESPAKATPALLPLRRVPGCAGEVQGLEEEEEDAGSAEQGGG